VSITTGNAPDSCPFNKPLFRDNYSFIEDRLTASLERHRDYLRAVGCNIRNSVVPSRFLEHNILKRQIVLLLLIFVFDHEQYNSLKKK